MTTASASGNVSRREFIVNSTSLVAAAPVVAGGPPSAAAKAPDPNSRAGSAPAKKLPIGIIDTAYSDLSLDEMLERLTAQGLEAVEICAGGYGPPKHIPVDDILADPAKG